MEPTDLLLWGAFSGEDAVPGTAWFWGLGGVDLVSEGFAVHAPAKSYGG